MRLISLIVLYKVLKISIAL